MTLSGVPYVWLLVRREFDSDRFLWATLVLVVSPIITTAWAATKLVCSVCRTPIYLFWLFGFPRHAERPRFDQVRRCPYCSDDGTGTTGDKRGVDPTREARRVAVHALKWLALFAGLLVTFLLAALMGWIPGYRRML